MGRAGWYWVLGIGVMHQVEKRRKFISQVVGKIIPMACQRREFLKSVEMRVEICEGG